jgi:Undecaprenyl-phosphate glucose phosphotransferase
MPNGNRNVFSALENYVDMLINVVSIYIAYFFTCLFLTEWLTEMPAVSVNRPQIVIGILVTVIAASFAYQAFNMYKQSTFTKMGHGTLKIIRVNIVFFGALAVLVAMLGPAEGKTFMMVWIAMTTVVSSAFLAFKRRFVIRIKAMLYSKQYILRKVIIIGDNTASIKAYINEIAAAPQSGYMVLGYVGNKSADDVGCEKLGTFPELERVLDAEKPTDVVFAIDSYDKRHLIRLVNICDDRCIKVYFLPVIYGFFKSSKQIEQVGDLPIINIHTTPLDNKFNAAVKRLIDIVGSVALILLTAPVMLFAAIGTKISSPGPILFKQKRVGSMGKTFTMLKFRSMWVNTTSDSAWSKGVDARKTKFGNFIRRTAIDELPQLFNVLVGNMSLVGPRPEIPKFVNEFKKVIPLYMIKHYVKPGMTGLAQIKGLRGDTSVEDRIHEDIAYIENWTLLLDLYILFKTPFKAFNKNEKYVEKEVRENPALYGIVDPSPELCEIENAISAELSAMEAADKASSECAAAEKEEKLTAEAQEGEAPQGTRELSEEKPLE